MIRPPDGEANIAATPLAEPWRLRHLLWIVLGVAVFLGAFALTGPLAVVLLLLLAIGWLVGSAFLSIRARDGQRYALLWMLAIAADHGMPLGTSVEAFAGQYRGAFRRRVARLAALLGQGAGPAFALRSVRGLVSTETSMLVEIGEENGRLAEALRRAAAQQADRSAATQELASLATYLGVVLVIAQAIVYFVLYFIMPKFKAIFDDFGIQLPLLTRAVVSAAGSLGPFALILLLPGSLLALVIPAVIWGFSTGGEPTSPAAFTVLLLVTALLGLLAVLWLVWSAGGVATPWSSRRRHSAVILRALAMPAEANRPIETGLQTLAIRYPSRRVRRGLVAAEADVRKGVDWREALRNRGLIGPAEFDALATAQAVGNLPWAMNDLADAALRRANLRRALLAQALWPLAVGTIGALVLFLAVAFFLPLIELIGRLA